MKFKYHEDGTLPGDDEIFVFGSNLAGRHGSGAAKVAHEKYGAIYGEGVGMAERSWAIPTKNYNIVALSIPRIASYIQQFVEFTFKYPEMKFFVTRIGCGLAGYKDSQIAPMFKECNINCNMPEEWAEFLESKTGEIE